MNQSRVDIRISGTRGECETAVRALELSGIILECSGFYPNRGASLLGRVYLKVEFSYETEPAAPELPGAKTAEE